jgi:hypothetical protein
MPKTEMNYSNTIIYKIVCNDLSITNCYVGHTTNFIQRKCLHNSDCNNKNRKAYNLLVYQTIRNNGNWENWSMIEIEKYPCNNSNEARMRERYWYEFLKADLNKQLPIRSKKEWNEDNKVKIKEYYKNKDEKKNICECGGKYCFTSKSKHFKTKKHQKYLQKP